MTSYPVIWQEQQAGLLRVQIQELLALLPETTGLLELIKESLTKGRRGLSEGPNDRPWSLLPLVVCEAICANYESALPIAASLQFLMAAGDVFDDVEDDDSSESLSSKYGTAKATNVATTLLILAERAIPRLQERGVEDYIIIRVMDKVNSFYARACAGQHLDLSLTLEITSPEEVYLNIISLKSASQIECACHIGALMATPNQKLIDMFSQFGHNLGMAAQMTNDINGIILGTDIVKRKITLPVIYAFNHADFETRKILDLAYSKENNSMPNSSEISSLMFRSGAIHYATVKTEIYKQQALDNLLEAENAGSNVERLKMFLE